MTPYHQSLIDDFKALLFRLGGEAYETWEYQVLRQEGIEGDL